jgi:co-chaperonin GroES (HSP10)
MQISALKDKVFIRVSPPHAEVGGGLVVPREARNDEHIGQVVASGPGASEVQEGDRVVFKNYGRGIPYDTAIVGEEELLVLRGEEVLAVLED